MNRVVLDPNTKKFRQEKQEGNMEEVVNPEAELNPEEENLAEQIREMLSEGYSGKEILQTGVYKESTVRQEVRKWMKKNGKPTTNNAEVNLPVKLGKGDTIPIETELTGIRLQDGEYRTGFIDGLRIMVLGAKLNQMLTANLSETTASQLALLKEAKSDSKEVAQNTVLELLPHFSEMLKESARASSPAPMQAMFARMMEGPLTQAMSGMFKMFPGMGQQPQGQGQALPVGWTQKEGGQ